MTSESAPPLRAARVAINGLGRIGRHIARLMMEGSHGPLELVAVNTLERIELAAHLLRYDSLYGRTSLHIEATDQHLVINGKQVRYFQQADPAQLPWADLAVDIVIECAGLGDKSRGHLEAGATRVIVAGSAPHPDITICMGVNQDMFAPERHHFLCGASCTATMAAPVVKVMDDAFGVEQVMMTFIHSYTNEQNLLDSEHPDLRKARAATRNIIPTSTSAVAHLSAIFPGLAGKIDGLALRVPTPLVHMADLVLKVKRKADTKRLLQVLEETATGPLRNILTVSYEPLVSADFRGWGHSSIVDAEFSGMKGDIARLVIWHDNEHGYCSRIVELASCVVR